MKALTSIILVALIWHLACTYSIVDAAFYPSPFSILKNTLHLLWNGDLLFHVGKSMFRLLLACLFALPFAITLAVASICWKSFDDVLSPLIALTFPLPKVAIYPLMLLIFGIDEKSKIALISVGVFYLVFINARLGLKRLVASEINDVITIYPLKKMDYIFQFLLKGSQLEIFTGVKLGLNYGLTLVIVGESSVSNDGIGYYIWRSWDQFNIMNVYSAVFTLSLIGCFIYYSFDKLISYSRKKYFD